MRVLTGIPDEDVEKLDNLAKRQGKWSLALLSIISLCLAGCVSVPDAPLDPRNLADWTVALRDSQTDAPFLMVFQRGGHRVILIGAEHDNRPDSQTFRIIASAFAFAPVEAVIVEGTLTSLGPNPALLREMADEPLDAEGLQPNGETVPTVRGAIRAGATLFGGEPDEAAVVQRAMDRTVTLRDIAGFYTLRVIPQWLRDGSASGPMDPRLADLIERQLERVQIMLGRTEPVFTDHADWLAWYRRTNGRDFGAGFDPEETGPLVDGPWGSNRIAASIARARDAHLLQLIGSTLSQRRSVMVVFGASHALILRSALEQRFGNPCYVGAHIEEARRRCLT